MSNLSPSAAVASTAPVRHHAGGGSLIEWVELGVATFGLQQLPQPGAVFSEMLPGREMPPAHYWAASLQPWSLERLAPAAALRLLAADYALRPAELFLLSVCGLLESSHRLNLAIAELQAPDTAPFVRVHLVLAMLNALFDESWTPADLTTHALLRDGVIGTLDDGPWPLRRLCVESDFWRLLEGAPGRLAGCRQVRAPTQSILPTRLEADLDGVAQMLRLGQASGVVIRGLQASGAAAAAGLAQRLDLSPVEVEPNAAQEGRQLPNYARYGGWLPVVALQLGPGEHFRPSRDWHPPVAFLTGAEGQVDWPGLVDLPIPPMPADERRRLWQRWIEQPATAASLARGALLDGSVICELGAQARLDASREGETVDLQHVVAARTRQQGKALRQLAQPVTRRVGRDALVLPLRIERQLEHLCRRCVEREALWEGLGPTAHAAQSTGVRALFCGASGTGKTLAASYMATRLGAPLYRLDLASVMNKYIGETEKNLGLLLDEAAAHDVVLLMDEADALFGRRTDAQGAGDRFANMLTNFLLTRIESHPGLVILTSNSQARIDPAFTRRLDSVVEFSLPGAKERLRIWQQHLGRRSPGEAICQRLASYSELSGGFIRNAVLNAAAQSPGADETLDASLLLDSLMAEYHKLGKAVPAKLEQLRQTGMVTGRGEA